MVGGQLEIMYIHVHFDESLNMCDKRESSKEIVVEFIFLCLLFYDALGIVWCEFIFFQITDSFFFS